MNISRVPSLDPSLTAVPRSNRHDYQFFGESSFATINSQTLANTVCLALLAAFLCRVLVQDQGAVHVGGFFAQSKRQVKCQDITSKGNMESKKSAKDIDTNMFSDIGYYSGFSYGKGAICSLNRQVKLRQIGDKSQAKRCKEFNKKLFTINEQYSVSAN